VGGSAGTAAFEIARVHPKLRCVVQDFASLQKQFTEITPLDLVGRVTFQGHDFFTEQPVKGAAVYFLRQVLHDWPDKYAQRIIRNLVPAMQQGNRLVIMDRVVPPRGVLPPALERLNTMMDLEMMLLHNSRERSIDDWQALVTGADSRFYLKGFGPPEAVGGVQVIEFVLG